MSVNDDVSMLAVEHELKLLEDRLGMDASRRQLTECVIVVSAPKEAALRETSMSVVVSADSDVVIAFKTCNRLSKSLGTYH